MAGKRLPPGKRKEQFSIKIRKELIDEIRKIPGYSRIVEDLIEDYLKKNKN